MGSALEKGDETNGFKTEIKNYLNNSNVRICFWKDDLIICFSYEFPCLK
jgi:hypothetical protein